MVSGQLAPCSEAEQSTEAATQSAASGSAQSLEGWQKEKQKLSETVAVLEKHKDWADKKIGQLIKRVTDAERPQKDEAYRLRDEVSTAGLLCCPALLVMVQALYTDCIQYAETKFQQETLCVLTVNT